MYSLSTQDAADRKSCETFSSSKQPCSKHLKKTVTQFNIEVEKWLKKFKWLRQACPEHSKSPELPGSQSGLKSHSRPLQDKGFTVQTAVKLLNNTFTVKFQNFIK